MLPRSTPHQISKLGMEIAAARIALSMFDVLPATHAERVLDRARREIGQAAEAASGAGHAAAAREVVAAARERAPSSSVTDRWPTILDAALSRLDAG
jgi:hypothetical protein